MAEQTTQTQNNDGQQTDALGEKAWTQRIKSCVTAKQEMSKTWQDSVSYRRGKPYRSAPPEDTVNIPADWSRTKNKVSQVFYQVPEVLLAPRRPEYANATATFAAALNFQLTEHVHAEHMMNEVLADVVNAAGIGICKIGYEGTFDYKDMPLQDPTQYPPEQFQQMQAEGQVETTQVPEAIYECYYARRISPMHFLWPIEFHGSNWQEAPWLGWEGYLPLAEAQRRGWVDEQFEGVEITDEDWLLIREWNTAKPTDKFVKFSEIFYKPAAYDPAEKDPRKIKRTVLIDNKDGKSQVVDEPLAWQKFVPPTPATPPDPTTGQPGAPATKGGWLGLTTFPLKVCHIAKISDLAIPPSDSEMGRPQVRELIKSRSQMIRQRDRSLPLRWFDINQVDGAIGDRLRKGKYQDMIPMNGPGDRAIGEVARAAYPPENWNFDRVIKGDLDEAWSMGAPQQGIPTTGETTATEIDAIQGASNTRLDFERQWVLRFFLEVASGIGSLMQMFADDEDWALVTGQDGQQSLQPWNKDTIQGEYIFSAKPDSQLRLDVNQKRAESLNLYKLLRKDPLINPTALVGHVLELHGMNPAKVLAKPQPPQPPPPRVSYSFKGEDLLNPIVIAAIQKSPSPITPDDLAAAKKLLADASALGPPTQPGMPEGQPGAPPPPANPGHPGPANPGHPGPADVIQPLNRRYAEQDAAGSRDSAMPTAKE